jgi:hypothetical protein
MESFATHDVAQNAYSFVVEAGNFQQHHVARFG